jgi:hypothetical protein
MNMSVRSLFVSLALLSSLAFSLGVIHLVKAQRETSTPSASEADVIDFEEFDLGGNTYLDVGSPLVFTKVGETGVDVDIVEGADNRIYDLFEFAGNPAVTGQALIDWPWPEGRNITGTTILFSKPVSDFSLQAGDFGGDDDSPLTITAYDDSDNVIGTDSASWDPYRFPPFAVLHISAAGIRKVVYRSGGAYENSTFIDNLSVAPWNDVYLPEVMR